MASSIAGIDIPDSQLAVETTEFIRDTESPLLYHHSRRTFLFGMLHGERRGLKADPELLYIGAMFHDLGLVEGHRNLTQRFEVDGADAARDFLASHGMPADAIRRVWSSIALHTTHGIPEFMEDAAARAVVNSIAPI
jgi:HD superfamily phosphodiesterase